MFYIFLAAFILIPILEIAAFIQIGSLIGLWPTLAGIVLTALIGAALVRHQGFKVLQDTQNQARQNTPPIAPLIHGLFILIAGLLLLTPGFVTDTIGFLFLVPPVRLALAGLLWAKFAHNATIISETTTRSHSGAAYDETTIIELEAEEISTDPNSNKPENPASPWSKGDDRLQ